jgi:hypothetical protein
MLVLVYCKKDCVFNSTCFLHSCGPLHATTADQLPFREGTAQPAVPGGARAAAVSDRRGALHRLQAV